MNMNSLLDIIGLLSILAQSNISLILNSKPQIGDTDFLIRLKFIHAHTFLIILITQVSSEDANSPQITQNSHVSITTILLVSVVLAILDTTWLMEDVSKLIAQLDSTKNMVNVLKTQQDVPSTVTSLNVLNAQLDTPLPMVSVTELL